MGTTALVLLLQKAATSQAIRATASALRKSTPDQRLSDARSDATEDASLQVVGIKSDLDAIGAELWTNYRDAKRERVVALGQAIIQLIADGHAKAEDFETEAQRAAVFEAIRFSMDALAPEVIPILARLALEPVDHFFRGLCRVVVDLDASEVLDLERLVQVAARGVDVLSREAASGDLQEALREWTTDAYAYFEWRGNRLVVSTRVEQSRERDQWLIPTWQETLGDAAPSMLALLDRNLGDRRARVLMLRVATVVKLKRVVLGS